MIAKSLEKSGAKFQLLYDENYSIAEAFGLDYVPPGNKLRAYNFFMNANLKEAHSDESQRLPIPATYVIDQHKKVFWRHFNSNYRDRSDVSDIEAALKKLISKL